MSQLWSHQSAEKYCIRLIFFSAEKPAEFSIFIFQKTKHNISPSQDAGNISNISNHPAYQVANNLIFHFLATILRLMYIISCLKGISWKWELENDPGSALVFFKPNTVLITMGKTILVGNYLVVVLSPFSFASLICSYDLVFII